MSLYRGRAVADPGVVVLNDRFDITLEAVSRVAWRGERIILAKRALETMDRCAAAFDVFVASRMRADPHALIYQRPCAASSHRSVRLSLRLTSLDQSDPNASASTNGSPMSRPAGWRSPDIPGWRGTINEGIREVPAALTIVIEDVDAPAAGAKWPPSRRLFGSTLARWPLRTDNGDLLETTNVAATRSRGKQAARHSGRLVVVQTERLLWFVSMCFHFKRVGRRRCCVSRHASVTSAARR